MKRAADAVETPADVEETELEDERAGGAPEDATDGPARVAREAGHAADAPPFEDATTPSSGEGEVDALFDPENRQVHFPGPGAGGGEVQVDTTLPPVGESEPVVDSVIADDWGRVPAETRAGATVVAPPDDDPAGNPLPGRAGGR